MLPAYSTVISSDCLEAKFSRQTGQDGGLDMSPSSELSRFGFVSALRSPHLLSGDFFKPVAGKHEICK